MKYAFALVVSSVYTMRSSKDIWSEEEVAEGSQCDDLADPRPQPEYDKHQYKFKLRQALNEFK